MITDIYTISKDDGQVIRLTDGLQLGMLGEAYDLGFTSRIRRLATMVVSVPRQAVVQVTTLIMTASLLSKTTVIQVLKSRIFLVGIGRDLSSDESNSSSKTSLEDKTSSSSFKADELKMVTISQL